VRRWARAGLGRSRLHDPHDVVRRELEAALRTGRRLVPVLVDRATLPDPAQLPSELRPLLERNAIELRDEAAPILSANGGAIGELSLRLRARPAHPFN